MLKRVNACPMCMGSHGTDESCSPKFRCKKEVCKKGEALADHHYLLCPKPPVKRCNPGGNKSGEKRGPRGLTEEQEAVVAQLNLSPQQLEEFRKAFTNTATSKVCAGKSLIEESGLKEHPVLMMLVDVTTRGGDCVGALIDVVSETNYITHQAAERLRLVGEPITLVVYGVGKMVTRVDTKRYLVTINKQTINNKTSVDSSRYFEAA